MYSSFTRNNKKKIVMCIVVVVIVIIIINVSFLPIRVLKKILTKLYIYACNKKDR